jgi:hypothetical protein
MLPNDMGWTGRPLRRDGCGTARMAGPGQHTGHGSGDADHGSATRGDPAPPAEPPALRDDPVDIQVLPGGPGWRLRHPERPPERIEIGHG